MTAPGERVFLVGSHEALGGWKPEYAMGMLTNTSAYPKWLSQKIDVNPGEVVEYKYVILREQDKSVVCWEDIAGTRVVTGNAGETIQVMAKWNDVNVTKNSTRAQVKLDAEAIAKLKAQVSATSIPQAPKFMSQPESEPSPGKPRTANGTTSDLKATLLKDAEPEKGEAVKGSPRSFWKVIVLAIILIAGVVVFSVLTFTPPQATVDVKTAPSPPQATVDVKASTSLRSADTGASLDKTCTRKKAKRGVCTAA